MLSAEIRHRAAADLAEAEEGATPIGPLVERLPGLDLDDAYAIQRCNIDRRCNAGDPVRGYKVGLTSRAMQEMLGVGEPDFGHLLASMVLTSGAVVPAPALIAPKVEVETAFVLGRALAGPGVSVVDVLRATEFVLPAIEVIDSRIAEWRISLNDTVADNASSARVVLGTRPVPPADLDLRLTGAVLAHNGQVVETGTGAAVLGHPAVAVAWLANTLADYGIGFEEGQVILPGSCTRAVDVHAGDLVRADMTDLGGVEVIFE